MGSIAWQSAYELPSYKQKPPEHCVVFNPYAAKLIYLNFQPLEVVSRYRDPQPQVVENLSSCLI